MRLRTLLTPALVVFIGAALSIGTALEVDRRETSETQRALASDAVEFGWLLDGFVTSFESTLSATAAVGLIAQDVPDALEHLVSTWDEQEQPTVLLDLVSGPEIIDVVGPAGVSPTMTRALADAFLANPEVVEQVAGASPGGIRFVWSSDGSVMGILAVAADGTDRVGALRVVPLGMAGVAISNEASLGTMNGFTLTAIDPDGRERTVMTTTDGEPLRGQRASAELKLAGETFRIEVSGDAAPSTPPMLILAVGLTATFVIASATGLASHRRRAAIDALSARAAAERRLRAALEASPDSVLIWHLADDTLTSLNRSELFGYPVLGGQRATDLFAMVERHDRDRLRAVAEDGAGSEGGIDIAVVTASGDRGHARVRISRLEEAGSDVVVVITDTTSRHQAEVERARLESDLQQAQRMETIGQLAGGIAHDFNNLLAAIASSAEIAALDATDPRVQEDLREILAATHRGATLTKRLLSFSRKGIRTREVVDLCSVVQGVSPLLRRMIDERIDLDVQTDACPLYVRGDAAELEQVLLNLVVNARDASRGPGHLITVGARRRDDLVVLTVADNGCGMPDSVRDHAMEPFFTTKDNGQGTGLGLAIVYGIAGSMGGQASIETEPGVGTIVTVEFPMVDAPATTAPPVVTRDSGAALVSTSAEHILLVEDEPAVLRAAQRLLERAGHTVRGGRDGMEAVQILDEGFVPSVLLTDVVLPGTMHGRAVAEHVRERHPHVRVIYASGYPKDVITEQDLIEDDVSFVAKPFSADALLQAVGSTDSEVSA